MKGLMLGLLLGFSSLALANATTTETKTTTNNTAPLVAKSDAKETCGTEPSKCEMTKEVCSCPGMKTAPAECCHHEKAPQVDENSGSEFDVD